MSLIQQLKELRAKATQGEWTDIRGYAGYGSTLLVQDEDGCTWDATEDAEYIVALHNSFDQIIAQLEAGESLAAEVRFEIVKTGSTTKVAEALAKYEQSTKEV